MAIVLKATDVTLGIALDYAPGSRVCKKRKTWMNVLALAGLIINAAAAQADETNTISVGGWNLKQSTNATAHAPGCVLAPKQQSRVQVGERRLIVSGLPRKSIFNYQYIIDDKPASVLNFPTEAMQNDGSIYLEGAVFDEILNAGRLRVRVLDKWHEAIAEDLDLTGLSELHQKMLDECK